MSRKSIRPIMDSSSSTIDQTTKSIKSAKDFTTEIISVSENCLHSLRKIWAEAGYEDQEQNRLLGLIANKIAQTLSTEVNAESLILHHAKQEVDLYISRLSMSFERLGRTANFEALKIKTVTNQLAWLDEQISSIELEISQRKELFDAEMCEISNLARELGEIQPSECSFNGPSGTPEFSDVKLSLMRSYKANLLELKIRRREEILTICKDCLLHMNDMSFIAEGFPGSIGETLDIDRFISDCALESGLEKHQFQLDSSKLRELKDRQINLVLEKDRRRSELSKTGEEIARLWSLLRVPSVERDRFSSSFKKNLSLETLNRGHNELARLKDLRKASLSQVVSSLRSDIMALWTEAGMDNIEARVKEFPSYSVPVESCDESLVDLHESYFDSLRKRVEELKPLLLKVSRRETIVAERIELEHLQLNPERLTARGPNAREERKREEAMTNRVKGLEKLTKEIITQIQQWEEINGPFEYCGDVYSQRIKQQEDAFLELKESLRNSRKKKDSKSDMSSIAPVLRTASAKYRAQPSLSQSQGVMFTPQHGGTSNKLSQRIEYTPANTTIRASTAILQENVEPADRNRSSSEPFSPSRDSEHSGNTLVKERDSNGSDTVVRERHQTIA